MRKQQSEPLFAMANNQNFEPDVNHHSQRILMAPEKSTEPIVDNHIGEKEKKQISAKYLSNKVKI